MTKLDEQSRPRRADARRNIAAILDAATEALARDPDATLGEIASAAGVGRVTLYGHFESRAVLVDAVVDRAIGDTNAALEALDLVGDPSQALTQLLAASWDLTYRFGALVVAAERTLPSQRIQVLHEALSARVSEVLLRGRGQGSFRNDLPLVWQLTVIQSLLHSATAATYRGELTSGQARQLVPQTVLAALRPIST